MQVVAKTNNISCTRTHRQESKWEHAVNTLKLICITDACYQFSNTPLIKLRTQIT